MLKSYITTIIIMSFAIALVSLIARARGRRNPGGERALSFLCAIAMLTALLSPLAGLDSDALAERAATEILGAVSGGTSLDAAHRDALRSYNAAALAEYADSEISVRARLTHGAATTSFKLCENERGEFVISSITVILNSLAAVARRDTIEAYLRAVFGSTPEIIFVEKVM